MPETAALGLTEDSVRVADYHPAWPCLFEQEKARIVAALAGETLRIEHIGSTAVSGLAAKPILDIAIAVDDLDTAAPRVIAALEALGYTFRGEYGLAGRLYFVRGNPRRTHHLHVVTTGSEHWERWLYFRDCLRADPKMARRYRTLKQALAEQFAGNRPAYTEGKTEFIESVLGEEPRP